MNWDGIVVFAVAYAIVVISPGPGLASFVGQILGHGIKAAPAQALGIYAGDLIWYGLAATGLAALAHAFAGVFIVVKWLGAAYLVYLAWKMWTAEVKSLDAVAARGPISHSQPVRQQPDGDAVEPQGHRVLSRRVAGHRRPFRR